MSQMQCQRDYHKVLFSIVLFLHFDVFQISTFENSARKWKWINRERIKAIIIIMFEIVSDVVRAFPP